MFAATYLLLDYEKLVIYLIIVLRWCTSHRAFLILLCCSTFMKMHSYAMTNINYYLKMKNLKEAKKQEDDKIKKVVFPDNVIKYKILQFIKD